MSNPIKGLADLYEESVKESDEAGLAEVYKQATERVFNNIREELEYAIEDVEYLDGYFIFGMGTNSVVHFHIKETPGWKYGIWWSPVSKQDSEDPDHPSSYETNKLYCSIFTQYEEEIDKFKPSASTFVKEFTFYLDNTSGYGMWEFVKTIKFIHDEPYLAFYREMHYTDFNTEHITRAKAKASFERHFKHKKLEKETVALNDNELLKTIYTILKKDIDEGTCFVHDRGDNWHPRYEIVMKNPFDIEDGCYGIFDIMEEAYATEARKLWDETIKDCEKRADKVRAYWYTCCHDSIDLISADRFNECFERANIVDVKKLIEETRDAK
jgi:hypothetical protein